MEGEKKEKGRTIRDLIERYRTSEHWAVSLSRDVLWLAGVVGGIALALYLICGTWPAVVTIESQSMVPHMNVGDLVIVIEKDRLGDMQTWAEAKNTGYMKFLDYGDVIVYRPNGISGPPVPVPFVSPAPHPIIHRAMMWIEAENISANVSEFYTPHAGYITKGDHNKNIDQVSAISGIGLIEPVKEEWIIGKALFTVPLVGYLPLHIVEVTVIILVVMAVYELYLRSKEERAAQQKKKPKKKRR
jgi:signal peptidase